MAKHNSTVLVEGHGLQPENVPAHFCQPRSLAAKYNTTCRRCGSVLFRVPIGGPYKVLKWVRPIFAIRRENEIFCVGWAEHCPRSRLS